MGWSRHHGPADRNEPVGNTCPKIDNIIEILEEVRDANSKLREWGNDLVRDLEKNDEEIEKLKARIEELESDLKDAHETIEKLENDNSD